MLFVHVVPPGRIAVLSGRKFRRPDGGYVGYRVVTGGRVMRIPIVETFDLMPEVPPTVPGHCDNVYFSDGTSGSIAFSATIVYAREDALGNAVERFLGQTTATIERVVREMLEGNVRVLAARCTREQFRASVHEASDKLVELATGDLERLGFELVSVSVHGDANTVDMFSAKLRDAGLLDIATMTELACDLAEGTEVDPGRVDLSGLGPARLDVSGTRIALRWDSAQVPSAQLLAGARILAALRANPQTYR